MIHMHACTNIIVLHGIVCFYPLPNNNKTVIFIMMISVTSF